MNIFRKIKAKFTLSVYDIIIFCLVDLTLLVIYRSAGELDGAGIFVHSVLAFIFIFGCRIIGKVYRQIWRYGGIQCYIRLLTMDVIACILYTALEQMMPVQHIMFVTIISFCCMNTLGALAIRMIYRMAYKSRKYDTRFGRFSRNLLKIFAYDRMDMEDDDGDKEKIKIAVIGAGSVGVNLAEELWNNPKSEYEPVCFVDSNPDKVGRDIHGVSVFREDSTTLDRLKKYNVTEVVFAIPAMDAATKFELYEFYTENGFKVKVYDFPSMQIPGRKRQLREFNIEDLLARSPLNVINAETANYYNGKVILITGGGGSIGSELCRQLAKMAPKQMILLDIYENCAYDVQQGLNFAYKGKVDIRVEIVSITNKTGLRRVFEEYRPQIVINAAAHKHVPLMEKNCIEAVRNNVFGTLNVVDLCEEYGAERFMMVSTDKAVNPTNVMGATKRVCEMITQTYSLAGRVKYSATRFGNVLGSAGSVIPLFKRQISAGGPVTVTDKRIVRYFMTIPEASQLVLQSGAMAENGELFVLDMGKPVKIWDLARNMVEMSGVSGIDIVEVGLRPGEKLYEELLVKSDTLEKTDNDMIFIEREEGISMKQLRRKLDILDDACNTGSDEAVRAALKQVVPTFVSPEEVNSAAV